MSTETKDVLADWHARKLLAELLGTYVLVLGGATAILASLNAYGGVDIMLVAFAFGLALLAGLYAFGEVSGGHFNPAVSLAMLLDGRIGVALMIQYWVAQIVGGVLAGFTLLAATSKESVAATATTFGDLQIWEAITFEAVFTAIFVAVILKVVKSATSSNTAFLAISFTLVVVHLALVPFTGASVNPARSLGSGVAGGVWDDQWVYWIAPLIGAVVGWAVHKAVTMDLD
jgi:aquaporin Z